MKVKAYYDTDKPVIAVAAYDHTIVVIDSAYALKGTSLDWIVWLRPRTDDDIGLNSAVKENGTVSYPIQRSRNNPK